MANAIRQEVIFKASPKRVYDALLDSKQFSEFSGGAPAEINRDPGGAFSCFGGVITGETLSFYPTSASFRHGALRCGRRESIRL